MFVKTISSVWVQQLHFIKEEIRGKLNELSGKPVIKEIRFLVGHTLVQEKEEDNISLTKKTVLKKRDKEMIAECTEALADSELAAILEACYASGNQPPPSAGKRESSVKMPAISSV